MITLRINDELRTIDAPPTLGGVLLVGFRTSTVAAFAGEQRIFAPDAFIRIDWQGKVTLIMLQVEMDQGGYTSIAMILAEERDAAIDQVSLEAAPPNDKTLWRPDIRSSGQREFQFHSRFLVTFGARRLRALALSWYAAAQSCPGTPLRKSGMSSRPQSARKMAPRHSRPHRTACRIRRPG